MARLEQLLEQVRKGHDIRQNLIEIRQNISDESLRRRFMYQLGGDFTLLISLLEDEDPKVRKNAALILGMTEDEDVLPALFEAWEKEETLFVRQDYLKAISNLNYEEYLPRIKARIQKLSAEMEMQAETDVAEKPLSGAEDAPRLEGKAETASAESAPEKPENPVWDNSGHLLGELAALRKMAERYGRHQRHCFVKMCPAPELILRTNLLHTDVTARQITRGTAHVMRGSVHVKGGDLNEILKIRTWLECLFPIPGARPIQGDERMIASRLRDLKISNYLNYLHEESGQPFRYRIELKSTSVPKEKKGDYIRRIASRLDLLEKGKLINSESDYEVELRLIERKDGGWMPMLKLYTLPDNRFAYRKETTAQSTAAPLAALAAELARPYLKEGAQILDPFCGVGTLLTERCLAVPADPIYGIDHYAEAVEKARTNAALFREMRSGMPEGGKGGMREPGQVQYVPVHYINRDFFDFTHEYLFDEIITYLPDVQAEEQEAFAERFLAKASGLLKDNAVLIVLTNAPSPVKKAAADRCEILEEFLLNERIGCTELIMKRS